MKEQIDGRESLVNDICFYMMSHENDPAALKDALYILLDKYEITSRSTEIAVLDTDRNEYLIKQFLIAKTVKGCSQRTLRVYGMTVTKILGSIGKVADDITSNDIRYYLALRQRRDKITKVTADNELRCLKSFFQYLQDEEIRLNNPARRVDKIKADKVKKEAFSDVEVEKIRLAAGDERERAIVEILLSTGCRVTELAQIRLSEIDGTKILIHGKGAKDRYVYLNAKAYLAMERYLKERKDTNPYLFARGKYFGRETVMKCRGRKSWWKNPEIVEPDGHLDKGSIEAITRKIGKSVGVTPCNPHKFRRTCATMALRRGMPVEQISKMLGHEEITTTQIYLDQSEADLEAAHRKYVT